MGPPNELPTHHSSGLESTSDLIHSKPPSPFPSHYMSSSFPVSPPPVRHKSLSILIPKSLPAPSPSHIPHQQHPPSRATKPHNSTPSMCHTQQPQSSPLCLVLGTATASWLVSFPCAGPVSPTSSSSECLSSTPNCLIIPSSKPFTGFEVPLGKRPTPQPTFQASCSLGLPSCLAPHALSPCCASHYFLWASPLPYQQYLSELWFPHPQP